MPAEQRGEAIRLRSGWWVLRYRDASGRRQRVRTSEGRIARFKTKTAALNQYRDVIAPQLRGERPVTVYTLGEFVPIFLERHAIGVRERTISTLRDRLRHPITAFDRRNRLLNVRRTLSSGKVVELAKTDRSRRQVPLTRRALAALDQIAPQVITPLLFTAPAGGLINLDNFRRREWAPAIEASGVAHPARIYDMRATYASESIAAGVGSDELARVMGTSVAMIEEHYGVLLGGAVAAIAARQDAYDADQDRAIMRPSDGLH